MIETDLLIDTANFAVVSGWAYPLGSIFRFMVWSAVALRCLLVLAFCLDGGASLWKASVMASAMAQQALAPAAAASEGAGARGKHHEATARAAAAGCVARGTFLAGNAEHQECDCDADGGCPCPCTFAVKLIAHQVPFAAQHHVPAPPAEPHRQTAVPEQTTSLFRPPIV